MIRWKPFGPYVTALLAILASLYYNHKQNEGLERERATAEAAVYVMHEALGRADSLTIVAAEANARADSLESVRVVSKPAVARIVATAPDTCGPVIAALTAQLAQAEAEAATRDTAYQQQKAATAALQPPAVHLADATAGLVKATRPSFLSRLVPTFGVGGAAGISALDRKPDAVIGVTVSWRF